MSGSALIVRNNAGIHVYLQGRTKSKETTVSHNTI
jgi:hypothetical protein